MKDPVVYRDQRYIDEILYARMVEQHMRNSLPDDYKKLNIEIEEV